MRSHANTCGSCVRQQEVSKSLSLHATHNSSICLERAWAGNTFTECQNGQQQWVRCLHSWPLLRLSLPLATASPCPAVWSLLGVLDHASGYNSRVTHHKDSICLKEGGQATHSLGARTVSTSGSDALVVGHSFALPCCLVLISI